MDTFIYMVDLSFFPQIYNALKIDRHYELAEEMKFNGYFLTKVDSLCFNTIIDWQCSEERIVLVQHELSKNIDFQESCRLYNTKSFRGWTRAICKMKCHSDYSRIIARAYGIQDDEQLLALHETVHALGRVCDKILVDNKLMIAVIDGL